MKKTKILIPALGMMMLSTAAAVSGTMAWFTANRSVQVSADEFAVQAIDGSLTVTPAEGIGTEVETNVVKMKNVGETVKRYSLADASFDINSKQLYTDIAKYDDNTGAGVQPDHYTKISTLAAAADNTWKAAGADIYYAATFTLNFTYTFSGDTRNIDLFFDPASTAQASLVTDAGSAETKKGFRMAFVCGNEIFAWAPFRTESESASLKYVKPADETEAAAATATSTGTYVTTGNSQDCICSDTAITVTDGQNGNTSKVNYLATLTASDLEHESNKAAVTCVVWFEGEDPDVINATKFQKISTLLKFYIRTAYAA